MNIPIHVHHELEAVLPQASHIDVMMFVVLFLVMFVTNLRLRCLISQCTQ